MQQEILMRPDVKDPRSTAGACVHPQLGSDLNIRDDLEREQALQDRIASSEDRAHAAPTGLVEHFVLAIFSAIGANCEPQCRSY